VETLRAELKAAAEEAAKAELAALEATEAAAEADRIERQASNLIEMIEEDRAGVEASVAPADAQGLNDNAHGIDRFGYRARVPPHPCAYAQSPSYLPRNG